mmetsp:Transcript_5812/g.14781  ORF Transcript_5812/g.14781 Transcript_5812/m.14781 type:complete len:200 (+) Transcript_5812:456-1055(+)
MNSMYHTVVYRGRNSVLSAESTDLTTEQINLGGVALGILEVILHGRGSSRMDGDHAFGEKPKQEVRCQQQSGQHRWLQRSDATDGLVRRTQYLDSLADQSREHATIATTGELFGQRSAREGVHAIVEVDQQLGPAICLQLVRETSVHAAVAQTRDQGVQGLRWESFEEQRIVSGTQEGGNAINITAGNVEAYDCLKDGM